MSKVHLITLIVTGLWGSGCTVTRAAARAAEPRAASAALRLLRVAVVEPEIQATDTDCNPGILKGWLTQSFQRGLLGAGYKVAAPGTPHDLELKPSLTIGDCFASDSTVKQGGTLAVSVTSSEGTLYTGQVDVVYTRTEDNWVSAFINAMSDSPAVIAFAASDRKGTEASAPTVATPHPAPDTPAIPSASRASVPAALPSPALKSGAPRGNAYALVIGIEKYRDAPAPLGARADAQHFAELAKTTLGVTADHLHVAIDDRATKTDLERELQWLSSNVPAGGRIYFFFAGHGAPDAAQGTPYLLPYDGDPKYVSTSGVQLGTVLESLGKTKAQDVVAFVDACFSGAGGRSVLPPGARPLVRVKEPTTTATPRVALLSSAAASEISGPTKAGGEGLFTHVLVEALGTGAADIDGDGNVSLAEVAQWVKPRVAREAKQDNRDQTPSLASGSGLGDPATVILASGLAK